MILKEIHIKSSKTEYGQFKIIIDKDQDETSWSLPFTDTEYTVSFHDEKILRIVLYVLLVDYRIPAQVFLVPQCVHRP